MSAQEEVRPPCRRLPARLPSKSPPGRRWLELPRPGARVPGLHLDTNWRNRAEFAHNREEAKQFLTRKWAKELDYRLIKELWAFTDNRIAVRYAYEWHDDSGNWYRSYGNENWEFDENGLMANRFACINDMPIKESERKFHWPWAGARMSIRACQNWGYNPDSVGSVRSNVGAGLPAKTD